MGCLFAYSTEWLFFRQQFSLIIKEYTHSINRKHAWKIISTLCHDVGLQCNYGTHTLRKTWGYQARQQGIDLTLIMYKLNHNSLAYTKRYLGFINEELEEISRRLNLQNFVFRKGAFLFPLDPSSRRNFLREFSR